MEHYVSCYSKPIAEMGIPWDDPNHTSYGIQEIHNWLHQLRRTFPFSAKNFHIKMEFDEKSQVKAWEVVLEYEEGKEEQAFEVVEELPYEWDYKAREALGGEYFKYIRSLKCPQDMKKMNPLENQENPGDVENTSK